MSNRKAEAAFPPRRQTTMRLQEDILTAVDHARDTIGMSRTQYVEQVLAKHLRGLKGVPPVRLKSTL